MKLGNPVESKFTPEAQKVVVEAVMLVALCFMNRAIDILEGKTESVTFNFCSGRYPRCEESIYRDYVTCKEIVPRGYRYDSANEAFNQILREMRDAGYDTKIVKKVPKKGTTATDGPCEGTPGALHYSVREGTTRWASIGECQCCEDNGGLTEPKLKTKCAIINPRY